MSRIADLYDNRMGKMASLHDIGVDGADINERMSKRSHYLSGKFAGRREDLPERYLSMHFGWSNHPLRRLSVVFNLADVDTFMKYQAARTAYEENEIKSI